MCCLTTNPCTQQHNYIYLLQDCFTLNVVTTLGVSELESVYSAYTVYCIIRKIPGVPGLVHLNLYTVVSTAGVNLTVFKTIG